MFNIDLLTGIGIGVVAIILLISFYYGIRWTHRRSKFQKQIVNDFLDDYGHLSIWKLNRQFIKMYYDDEEIHKNIAIDVLWQSILTDKHFKIH